MLQARPVQSFHLEILSLINFSGSLYLYVLYLIITRKLNENYFMEELHQLKEKNLSSPKIGKQQFSSLNNV